MGPLKLNGRDQARKSASDIANLTVRDTFANKAKSHRNVIQPAGASILMATPD
jgi:hypothetical protein